MIITKRRDSRWTMIKPGCYLDPAGIPHIFPDEIIAFLQIAHPQVGFDPNDKADYDLCVRVYTEVMQRHSPGIKVRVIKHERVMD